MAAFNQFADSAGGVVEETKPKVKKPTKKERWVAWKKENAAAVERAHNACCVCTPTRTEALLVQAYNHIDDWEG
jgi:hypothetical protein